MRTTRLLLCASAATLMSVGAITAQAGQGVYYDPSNAASSTGKTIGYELYRTIGCPGKQLLDQTCAVPKEVDSDGDGVVDSKDKCYKTQTNNKDNNKENKQNSDGDGIVDGDDKCPTVYAKTDDGCPAVVAAPVAPAGPAAPVGAPATKKK